MKHSVSHGLDRDLARKAVRRAFESYGSRFPAYSPQATWQGEDRADIQFTAKGVTLRGSIEIRESSIDLDLEVPFLLRPFKDKALSLVDREIGRWVDKARRGEV